MAFEIIKPGLLTLLQDSGRFGHMHQAICWSQPVDIEAFYWNNCLLKNNFNAAQLEIHQGLLKLKVIKNVVIAVCGHGCTLYVNEKPKSSWCVHHIKAGSQLYFKKEGQGQVIYLAVQGGFLGKLFLKSVATTTRLGIGSSLKQGEVLTIKKQNLNKTADGFCLLRKYVPTLFANQQCSKNNNEDSSNKNVNYVAIALIKGFNPKTLPIKYANNDAFFTETFVISGRKNRMGICLEYENVFQKNISAQQIEKNLNAEKKKTDRASKEVVKNYSEGLVPGTVQILPSGLPIVLGPDAQTIGGYPKIGIVFSLYLGKLYQLPIGTKVRFFAIAMEEANEKRKHFYEILNNYI